MLKFTAFIAVALMLPSLSYVQAVPLEQTFCEGMLGGTHYVEDRQDRCAMAIRGLAYDVPVREVLIDSKVYLKDSVQKNYSPLEKK